MASKRQIRRRACSGKQRYADTQTAFGVMRIVELGIKNQESGSRGDFGIAARRAAPPNS